MKCALHVSGSPFVMASGDGARGEIILLRAQGVPSTLIMTEPGDMNLVRDASYSPDSTLHVFEHACGSPWSVPYLRTASRCGIRSAVTIHSIGADMSMCAEVLEKVSAFSVNCRMSFFFMAGSPMGGLKECSEAFADKLGLYMECTQYEWGMCGRDCQKCLRKKGS